MNQLIAQIRTWTRVVGGDGSITELKVDKIGTLTLGRPVVTTVVSFPDD